MNDKNISTISGVN